MAVDESAVFSSVVRDKGTMTASKKVALITGGAAGMGLAVAQALIKGSWLVVLADVNENTGKRIVAALGDAASFQKTDVTQYSQQLEAFEATFKTHGRIDFVFANAGIAGGSDFYDAPKSWPPEAPSLLVEDICLRGVVFTSYLAMQYMRRNETPGGVIVMTASAASIYASPDLPLYSAAKHGVLGLMRSMSESLRSENIRVNAILPGAIRTTLHSEDIWKQFPRQDFTPVEEIVSAVLGLVNEAHASGRALEISKGDVVDRKQPEYCNETMSRIMQGKTY